MNNYLTDSHTRTGTVGGMLSVLLFSVNGAQLIATVITAATGALVSFGVSVLCKWIVRRFSKDK